jgi:DnaK suppressor protein
MEIGMSSLEWKNDEYREMQEPYTRPLRKEGTMNRTDIKAIRQELQLQRDEILEFLRRLENETRSLDVDSGRDVADRCALSMSKESLFDRSSQQRLALRLIEGALGGIANGSFGVCVACGDDIPDRRLEALPWTQYCLSCQEAVEDEVGSRLSSQAQLTAATRRSEDLFS